MEQRGDHDHDTYRRQLRYLGISFAWSARLQTLRTRHEHHAGIHLGLLQLACALICYRHLEIS
jgi:hypothetical protein